MVELKQQLPIFHESFVVWPAMTALTTEQLLIPAAARFHIPHGNQRLNAHGRDFITLCIWPTAGHFKVAHYSGGKPLTFAFYSPIVGSGRGNGSGRRADSMVLVTRRAGRRPLIPVASRQKNRRGNAGGIVRFPAGGSHARLRRKNHPRRESGIPPGFPGAQTDRCRAPDRVGTGSARRNRILLPRVTSPQSPVTILIRN